MGFAIGEEGANAGGHSGGVDHVLFLPRNEILIGFLPWAEERGAALGAQCLGDVVCDDVLFLQCIDFFVRIGPHSIRCAALIEGRAGDQVLGF